MNYVNASVNGEVLSIGTNGGFATNETIKMTVSLPADKLSAIDHYGPGKIYNHDNRMLFIVCRRCMTMLQAWCIMK